MFELCFVCGKERLKNKICQECGCNYFANLNVLALFLALCSLFGMWMTVNYANGLSFFEDLPYPLFSILGWVSSFVFLHVYITRITILTFDLGPLTSILWSIDYIKEHVGVNDLWIDVYYMVIAIGVIYIIYMLITMKKRRKSLRENFDETIELAESMLGRKVLRNKILIKFDLPQNRKAVPSDNSPTKHKPIKWA